MPTKKKKTQLKPVVRGFATTSQPKKITQDVAVNSSETFSLDVEPEGSKDCPPESTQPAPSPPMFDPDSVNHQFLQSLVDKLQEKTEKEISRYISVKPFHKYFSYDRQ